MDKRKTTEEDEENITIPVTMILLFSRHGHYIHEPVVLKIRQWRRISIKLCSPFSVKTHTHGVLNLLSVISSHAVAVIQ
jgi:hypothetical protein